MLTRVSSNTGGGKPLKAKLRLSLLGVLLGWSSLWSSVLFQTPVQAVESPLTVAVAANFVPVMQALAQDFQRQSGVPVKLVSGSTGKLYVQIRQGAPFDVFLAADRERPRRLQAEGRTVGPLWVYALGRLALWSPDPQRVDAQGRVLELGQFKHLALANPKLAPYGLAAVQVLRARQLEARLKSRWVMGENVSQAMLFAQSGNAELAFVAYAHILALPPAQRGSYWLVPTSLYAPLEQAAVGLTKRPIAQRFMAFMRSESSRQRIRAAGYDLPAGSPLPQ